MSSCVVGALRLGGTNTINQLFIHDCAYIIDIRYGATVTLTNVYGRVNTREFYLVSISGDSYFVNPDLDDWVFIWGGTSAGEVYRQYEFDLNTTFANATAIQNANVTLSYYGQGGGTVGSWLTYANGTIPTQTLNMGFYNQTGANAIYNYNPYNITVTRSGYQTYSKNFTLDEKTDWTIALQESTAVAEGFNSTYYLLGAVTFFPFLLFSLVLWRRKRKNEKHYQN